MTDTRGNPAMLKAAAVLGVIGVVLLLFATSGACQGIDAMPKEGTTPPKSGMKFALTFMAAGQGADLVTTTQALNRGAVESNPIYGKHPSAAKLVAAKLPMLGLGYLLHRIAPRNPKLTKGIAYTIGGVGMGLAISNSRKGRL
jgi:hypothetical protein